MNERIKQLAKQAELLWIPEDKPHLERFAELVRQDEREACAKAVYDSTDWAHEEQDMTLKETIAAAIRARGDRHD